MNSEDRLRHACREMHRVAASVTAPNIDELHRSAKMQTFSVALASSLAVLVLIGGAALLLNGTRNTTLRPAEPSPTTATTATDTTTFQLPAEIAGIPVRIPELDPEPRWSVDEDATEAGVGVGSPVQLESDLSQVVERLDSDLDGDVEEILVLGESGGWRSYLLRGQFTGPDFRPGMATTCAVSFNEDTAHIGCFGDVETFVDMDASGAEGVYGIVGSTSGANAALLIVDGSQTWVRTHEGTYNLFVRGPEDAQVEYVIYDIDGGVLANATMQAPVGDSAGDCSAGSIAPSALGLSSIPQPVAQTLVAIVDAARECDFAHLATIGGDDFTASFGGDDPATLWTMQEDNGEQPMYALMQILDMPYGTVDLEDELLYVWPSPAAFYGPWGELPETDRQALLSLYTEQDLQGFAEFGGYYGYRIGITASGDWSFFVAGD